MKKKKILVLSFDKNEANVIATSLKKNSEYTPDLFSHFKIEGIQNGIVTDISQASDSIQRICTKMNNDITKKTHNIALTLSTSSVEIVDSDVTILISKYSREINNQDIDRCLKLGGLIKVPEGKEIIHKIVVDFVVDNDNGIINPLGLEAVKLGVRMKIVLVDATVGRNIEKAVSLAGYDVNKIILNPIANYTRVFEKGKKTMDILVNVKQCSLELSCFDANVLVESKYIEKVVCDISGKHSLIHPKTLSDEIMAMKNFSQSSSIHIIGDIFNNDMVSTHVEEITGLYTAYGRCLVKPLEGLPEDRLRYISALGAIDHINKSQKASKPTNLLSTIKNAILTFLDEYF